MALILITVRIILFSLLPYPIFSQLVLAAEEDLATMKQKLTSADIETKAALAMDIAEKIAESRPDAIAEIENYISASLDAVKQQNKDELYITSFFRAGKLSWRIDRDTLAIDYYKKAAAKAQQIGSTLLPDVWFYTGVLFFERQEFDVAVNWLEKCVDNAQKRELLKTLPRCSNLLANIHNAQGRPTKAIPLLKTALELEEAAGNQRGIAAISNNLGLSYSKTGLPDKAVEYYLKSLVIEEKIGNLQGKVISLMNVATIFYHELSDKESAFNYLNEAIELAKKQGMKPALPILFVNKASFLHEGGQIEASEETYLEAIALAEEVSDVQNKTRSHLGLGDIYLGKEKVNEALEQFRLANEGADQLGSDQEKIIAQIGIGESLAKLGQVEEGIEYLIKALALAKKLELTTQSVRATIRLSDAYEAKGDFQSSSKYLREYILYKEQIITEHNKEAIALFKTRYETEKKEAEIALLKKDNELKDSEARKDKRIKFWLYAFIIMIGISVLITLNRYFAQRKSKRLINQKNTELIEAYEQLKQISLTDPLTNLSNRRAMKQFMADELDRFERKKVPFSILLIDIDFFKKLNDTYGHDGGDFVLVELSKLMASLVRKQDKVCRWGGEEFLFLLPDTDIEGAKILAEKVRTTVMDQRLTFREETISTADSNKQLKEHELRITISMGVSEYNDLEMTLEQAIKIADQHLYKAKEQGRNCVVG